MTTDRISILLEIFSFFFVTLDLFGKERLSNLYHRITNYLKELQQFKGRQVPSVITIPIGLLSFVIFAILYVQCFKFLMWNIPRTTPYVLGSLALMLVVFGFFTWMWMHVFGYSVLFILSTLDATVGRLIRLLYRFKLEGIMMIIGAVLFLVSKVILFWYST